MSSASRHTIDGWHEKGCRRPDVVLTDNIPTCISCGSIYTHAGEDEIRRGELSVTTPMTLNALSTRTELHLNWPSTITFSSPADIEDEDIRAALKWLQRIKAEPRMLEKDERDQEDVLEDPHVRLHRRWEKFRENPPLAAAMTLPEPEGVLSSNKEDEVIPASYHSRLYHPLSGQDQIRLLYLSPSPSGDGQALHGVLVPSHLSDRPEFTALSYTWADASGDRSRRETIFIGSEWAPLPITSNCAAALRYLRSPAHVRFVWVDAVCIDQDNMGERGHQVGLMRDIYSRAQRVVVFLGGEERGGMQKADVRLMARMADECFYKGSAVQIDWHPVRDDFAVQALFERPYWNRIWVIQEVMLAKEALVVLGGSSVPLACILRGQMTGRDTKPMFPSWTQLSGPSAAGDVGAFSKLLAKTSHCQAADQRDKVFALLGLVQGAHLEGLVADYTKTSEEIYTGIAAYFLIRHGQVSILKWGSAGGSLSWVPTWGFILGGPDQASPETDYYFREQLSSYLLSEKLDWSDTLSPDHWCGEKSGSGPSRVADALDVLQPRVFQGTGALLIRAYPVLRLDSKTLYTAFVKDQSFGGGLVLKASVGVGVPQSGVQWGIFCVASNSYFGLSEGWIVEVPNCDAFLYLRKDRLVPGLYRIASVCNLALVANIQFDQLTSQVRREGRPLEEHALFMRLLLFELRQLLFLQSWEEVLNDHSSLKPSEDLRLRLSAMDLIQYSRWMEYISHHPESQLGPTSDGRISDFDPTLKTVSSYLDGWANLELWESISKVLESIEWSSYVKNLEEIRLQAVSDLAAPRPQEIEICDNKSPGFWRRDVKDRIGHRVEELLKTLMDAVDLLGLPGLDGKTMRLGDFCLAETAGRLRGGVEIISGFWAADKIQAMEAEYFAEWTAFASHLRYMRDSNAEYGAIRGKFIQRQVLRGLYTKSEPREFLIC